MQYGCATLSFVACMALPCFPTWSHKGHDFQKILLNIKCVFWFPLQIMPETFPIIRRKERDIIKKIYIGLHAKYPLFMWDFNEPWIFWTNSGKILRYHISWKSVQWKPSYSMRTYTRTDRQTDRQTEKHDEINSRFSKFCEKRVKTCPFENMSPRM